MADFNQTWPLILQQEGSTFTDDPVDPGGPTKFGLTLKFINDYYGDNQWTVDTLKAMDEEEAKDIYYNVLWSPYRMDDINNQEVADKIFSMIVNIGYKNAIKIVQKSVNLVNPLISLVIDGILGSKTIVALNTGNIPLILNHICVLLWEYYEQWISQDPRREKFRKGLYKRAMQ